MSVIALAERPGVAPGRPTPSDGQPLLPERAKKFSDIELMKRFDMNKDGRLDRAERDAARPAASGATWREAARPPETSDWRVRDDISAEDKAAIAAALNGGGVRREKYKKHS